MAIQFQLRRGTTVQNNAFVGAEGEITVDTEKHAIRIHDGVTPGGYTQDFVTESWISEDGLSWYRKYASGWVEQGGHFDKGGLVTDTTNVINLVLPMSDINYTLVTQSNRNNDVASGINNQCFIIYRTTTEFKARCYGDGTSQYIDWQVSGMAA